MTFLQTLLQERWQRNCTSVIKSWQYFFDTISLEKDAPKPFVFAAVTIRERISSMEEFSYLLNGFYYGRGIANAS